MNNEITLEHLWKVFKSAWWKIVIFAILAAVIGAGITIVAPDKYASSTSFYINNASTTSEYTSSSILAATEYLANDYVEIILGDAMVSEMLQMINNKDYSKIEESEISADDIRDMISSKTSSRTSIFSIVVTCSSAEMAQDICTYIELNAPANIKKVARPATEVNIYYKDGDHYFPYENQLECVSVVRSASKPSNVSAGIFTGAFIGGAIGAILTYAYFFLRKFFDTTIRSARDVKELVKKPILADIPDWDLSESLPKYKSY